MGVLDEGRKRFDLCRDAAKHNHRRYLDAIKFRNLDQWPSDVINARGKERPVLVVDKLNQYVRQVVNDGRQNRPAVKVRPVDDGADIEIAEKYDGLIRHVCNRSNADEAFDTALDCAASGGFGYFRVLTEYAGENTFNQEIRVLRIRNPLAVYLDPMHKMADGSDAKFGFIVDDISKEDFKVLYPKAKETGWDASVYPDGWIAEDTVKVCEYWYVEEVKETLHLLEDGTTAGAEEYEAAIAAGVVDMPVIVESREIPARKVKFCRMTGAEVLYEQDWLGKFIPIVPVYGNEVDIEGKVFYSGLIFGAMDAQRLYNYSRSAYAERVALTPKAPFIAAAGQVEQYDEWKTANTDAHSVLRYDPQDVAGNPVPPPQRQQASDIPEGFARDMQLSEHDIQASMGMYSASLGERSNEKSGRAIMARQREGDTATFHYQDNLNRAIRYLGRILVDLIPKVYDSKRVLRILGEDGAASMIDIDPAQEEAVRKIGDQSIYNLNVGTYDVDVSAGPSYNTKRMESADAMLELTRANPALFQTIGDLMVRNMDWPGADEISKRLKKMLPPGLADEEEGESPEVQAVKAQAQQVIDQAQQQIQAAEQGIAQRDAEIQRLTQEQEQESAKNALELRKLEVDEYRAETERMAQLTPALTPEQVSMIVQQTVRQIMETPIPIQPEPQQPPSGGFFTPEEGALNGPEAVQ